MPAELTYYIYEGLLVGKIENTFIQMSAVSGGGGGSKIRAGNDSTNNPYLTALKEVEGTPGRVPHVHGGPIPLGRYKIDPPGKHPKLGRSARLTPEQGTPMFNRDGFYIHGRGPHGSDGCVVPMKQDDFSTLLTLLERSRGGTLFVLETTDGMRFG